MGEVLVVSDMRSCCRYQRTDTERCWSVVRIDQVDDDRQVRFAPMPADDPVAAPSPRPSA
jgi:hypothetical protein